jgi:hypothetical protein
LYHFVCACFPQGHANRIVLFIFCWAFLIFSHLRCENYNLYLVVILFFFSGTGVWTQGFAFAKQALLPLEPQLQPIFLWLFWRWALANCFPGWPQTMILWMSASQVARIIGISHQHPAIIFILIKNLVEHLFIQLRLYL